MAKSMAKKGALVTGLLLMVAFVSQTAVAQLPGTDEPTVYVMGQVVSPRALPLKEGITLIRAIAMAGGPLKDSKYDKVILYRTLDRNQLRTCVSLKAISKRRISDVQLQAYDIIEVVRGECAHPMCWDLSPRKDLPLRVIK
jgi:hypothetical protein